MSHERSVPRATEQSIKARQREIFEKKPEATESVVARKPFIDYLRETPAAPLSLGLKAALAGVGMAVTLLFSFALVKANQTPPPRPHHGPPRDTITSFPPPAPVPVAPHPEVPPQAATAPEPPKAAPAPEPAAPKPAPPKPKPKMTTSEPPKPEAQPAPPPRPEAQPAPEAEKAEPKVEDPRARRQRMLRELRKKGYFLEKEKKAFGEDPEDD